MRSPDEEVIGRRDQVVRFDCRKIRELSCVESCAEEHVWWRRGAAIESPERHHPYQSAGGCPHRLRIEETLEGEAAGDAQRGQKAAAAQSHSVDHRATACPANRR